MEDTLFMMCLGCVTSYLSLSLHRCQQQKLHGLEVLSHHMQYNKADDDESIRLVDRKSTRLNSSHSGESRMPSSA